MARMIAGEMANPRGLFTSPLLAGRMQEALLTGLLLAVNHRHHDALMNPAPCSASQIKPAVDIIEKDNAYEITADLPGMDEKNIEVKLSNDGLTIRGVKQEEKEEQKRDYYLHERSFGAFERSFTLPEGVDADKIEASFKKGVLTVTLPKRPEAIKPEKQIPVKPGT